MEYERIHEVQTGIISPTKLRMKLMGPHHGRKKEGSNSNSSRTSPSKMEDAEFVKNSLLASNYDEVAAPSLELPSVSVPCDAVVDRGQVDRTSSEVKETVLKENGYVGHLKLERGSKGESGNSSDVHSLRQLADENVDYDSNASSSSFEFHKERSVQNQFTRSFSRPMSSKWNDAEKWIKNRQNVQPSHLKQNAFYNQANRIPQTNMVRVAPDSANHDLKLSVSRMVDTKRIDPCQKFSFIPPGTLSMSDQAYGGNLLIDQCTQSRDLKEVDRREFDVTSSAEDPTVLPVIRSVCMRDMGTEMTPVTSQEPSRTASPLGATTPFRSPTSSIPSTPRRGAPASTLMEHGTDDGTQNKHENGKRELTEQELKLKTRREIVDLGVKLGKMNIAAWAGKEDQGKNTSSAEALNTEELEQIEFAKRAAAWEEAEKSKHAARFKREEIKIQAWESQQKAILEAEMRKIEAQVEQMRAQAHAKMVKKIAMARQKSGEKRAAAEARKNRDAERTAAGAEYIRQTGQMPSSHFICCGLFS